MCQSSDIFELIIQLTYWNLEKLIPKKYLTLEMNMMVGNVIKTISFIIIVFALDILNGLIFAFYSLMWLAQAIFVKYESDYIFHGISVTKKREFGQKLVSFFQDYCQVFILFLFTGTEDFLSLLQERKPSFYGIYKAILLFLLCFDLLELIFIVLKVQCCQTQNLNYEGPGQGQYFLKFRLIGGIIGIVIMLIFYLIFQDQKQYKNAVQFSYFVPIHSGVEVIILITSAYQLCRKRSKERLVVSDKVATEKQLRIKKWYCIILGLTYGLFEVPVAAWILYVDVVGYILFGCNVPFCGKFLCAGEIIEYEIVDEREQNQEQIMIQI